MLLDILMLIGLSQGIIFGIVLMYGKIFKDKTNRYLAFSIIILSVIGLNEWAIDQNLDDTYYLIDFFGDDVPWILLVFVPAYMYFKKSLDFKRNTKFRDWMLTIPFLIFLLLNIIIDLNIDFFLIDTPWFVTHKFDIYFYEYYSALFYTTFLCILSFIVLRKGAKPANTKKWLKWIWFFYSVLIVIWISLSFIPEDSYKESMDYVFWISASFFIYWLIYKGLLQFHLAKDISSVKRILANLEGNEDKQTKHSKEISDRSDREKGHLKKLKEIVEDEHLYRDPDLSLQDVADRLQLSAGYLSQLINTNLDINFTVMINRYRVEEVKKLVNDETFNQYSLLSIGLEAGFRSKSAFYSIFKKETGLTPNEYKKSINKS